MPTRDTTIVLLFALAAVALLLVNPALWFLSALLVLFALGARLLLRGLSTDQTDHAPPANCPDCGAPNDPDATTCQYCDAAL
ncbi:hypothetical protein [Halocalculus aciditolerans]|uniref:Zinc ribbon domain-containing protein n=1 Tax=Halocalculus aciditolerans TaxID=1383812 RepID=A0A830FJK7_9EURY|nr:hypothetical protein [Halocalculus aciditolerans]GGL53172.1 hypothetical protein GCM10009039_09230 [Halocalculus aciditolerans]